MPPVVAKGGYILKIERLLGLLCILVNTDKITVQELANRFRCRKGQFFVIWIHCIAQKGACVRIDVV